MTTLNVRTPVWVKNPVVSDIDRDNLWIPTVVEGKMPDRDKYSIRVKINNKEKAIKIGKTENENDEIKLRNPVPTPELDNILDLPYLNEPEILMHLKERYEKGATFTFTGSVLLSINPFDDIIPTEDSKQLLNNFILQIFSNNAEISDAKEEVSTLNEGSEEKGSTEDKEEDHISLKRMDSLSRESATGKHTIIISGESGSGKSVCFKTILAQLAKGDQRQGHSSLHGKNEIIDHLSSCNVLLETFGNAKTVHTSNSSRFGKLLRFRLMNNSLKILSCSIQTFLLEQSRICRQGKNERNFNIFYQLINGINTLSQTKEHQQKRFHVLSDCNDYHYLARGGTINADEVQYYASQYPDFIKSLENVSLHQYIIDEIQSILSGILLLGNIVFDSNAADDQYFSNASELLGLPKETLISLLTKKHLATPNGDRIELDLDQLHSITARDAIVKLIYRCLFLFLVEEMNNKLALFMATQEISDYERNAKGNHNFVQVLDIFGFDSFEKNSIDQMCINYANETLHKQFNSYVFQTEMELYEKEQINYDKIDYLDNTENCELVGNGIFRILDDQCRLPHPTDKRFIAQLYKEYDLHPLFSVSELQHGQDKFTIKHYAGNVEYQADDFVTKNVDFTPADTAKVLSESKISILANEFATAVHVSEVIVKRRASAVGNKGNTLSQLFTNKKIKFGLSLVTEFKNELTQLLKEIDMTSQHYIKCIKSYDGEKLKKPKPTPGEEGKTAVSAASKKRFSIFEKEINRFSQYHVSQQLQSNGILETVRIAVTGYQCRLPYVQFYSRYRLIGSEIDPNLEAPLYLKDGMTDVQVKLLCNRLCDVLAVGRDGQPKVLSPGTRTVSRERSLRRTESFARSRSMRTISMKDFNVDSFSLSDGVIDRRNIQFGETKIFMKLQEHSFLEAFRNKCLKQFAVKIQRIVLGTIQRKKFLAVRKASIQLQKVVRGYLVRKRIRVEQLLLKSILYLQRRFRKLRFLGAIARIQSIVRRFLAKRKLQYLKDLKEKLVKTYGQFIIAREMRLQRRGRYQKLLSQERETIIPAASFTPSYKMSTVEQRMSFYLHQIKTINEKLQLSNLLPISPASPVIKTTVPQSPESYSSSVTKKTLTAVSDGKNGKKTTRKHKVGDVISPITMNSPSIIDVIDKNMKNLPIQPVAYDDLLKSWKRQLELLSENVSNRPIKIKATKYLKYLKQSEELIETKGLIDFSIFGKVFGYTLWKNLQSLPLLQDIPDVHITESHVIFQKIRRMIERLQSLSSLIDETMSEAKDNILVKVQYETNQADVQVIYEFKQLCKEFIHYYEQYVHYFVSEFGESSSFYQAFVNRNSRSSSETQQQKDHLRYLLALVDIIEQEKKYALNSQHLIAGGAHYSNTLSLASGGGGQVKKSKKNTNVFTLTIDWQEMIQNLPAHHPLSIHNSTQRNSREFFFNQFGINDSDTLRKLLEVYEGKEEIKLDNLRIVSYNGLQFHYMPIQPGIEYSINSFRNLISGRLPPVKRLLKIVGSRHQVGKTAYYSVFSEESTGSDSSSSTLVKTNGGVNVGHDYEHHSFMDVLYDPIALEQIEPLSFSSSVLSCCILGILHLQPNHIAVHLDKNHPAAANTTLAAPDLASKTFTLSTDTIDRGHTDSSNSGEHIRISSFESDAVMSSGFLDFNNTYRLKVHEHNLNVLFVLPQMDEPIDSDLKNFLISSPFIVEEIIINWLRDLHDQNSRYRNLVVEGSGMRNGAGASPLSDGVKTPMSVTSTTGVNTSTFDLSEKDLQALDLPIFLAKDSVKEMMKRLRHIVEFISDKQEDRATITNSKLLREFFPHVSDYYEEIRYNSDFTEGIDIGGVVSYAYAYHSALKELKEWSLKLSSSIGIKGALYFENLTENTDESNGSVNQNAPANGGIIGGLSDLFQKKAIRVVQSPDEELTPKSNSSDFWAEIPVVKENYAVNPLRKQKDDLGSASTSQYNSKKHLYRSVDDMDIGEFYESHTSVKFPLGESYGSPLKRQELREINSRNIGEFDNLYTVQSGFSKQSFLSAGSMNSNRNTFPAKKHKKDSVDSFDYDDVFEQDEMDKINSSSMEEYLPKAGEIFLASSPNSLSPSRKRVSFSTPKEGLRSKSAEPFRPVSRLNLQSNFQEVSPMTVRKGDFPSIAANGNIHVIPEEDHGVDGDYDQVLNQNISPAIQEVGQKQQRGTVMRKLSKSAIETKIKDRNDASATSLLNEASAQSTTPHSALANSGTRARASSGSKLQSRLNAARAKTALYGSNVSLNANFEKEIEHETSPTNDQSEAVKGVSNLEEKMQQMKMRREAFQTTQSGNTVSPSKRASAVKGQHNDTMKMVKRRQTFLQSDDIQVMNGKILNPKTFLQDSTKEFTKRVAPLDTPIDIETTDFLKSIDFRVIREKSLDYQQVLSAKGFEEVEEEGKNGSSALAGSDFSSKLCRLIGKNLCFLESLPLVNINEQQLKAMFKYYLKANLLLAQHSFASTTGLKKSPSSHGVGALTEANVAVLKQRMASLQIKTILLYFDSRDELNVLRKSYILYQLKKELNLDIKLIFNKAAASIRATKDGKKEQQQSIADSPSKKIQPVAVASPDTDENQSETPNTVRNTDSNESGAQLPQSVKSQSGRFIATPNGSAKRSSFFFYEDGNEEIVDYTIQFIVTGSPNGTPNGSAHTSMKHLSEFSQASDLLDQEDVGAFFGAKSVRTLKSEPTVNEELRKELLSILMGTSNLFLSNGLITAQGRQDIKTKIDQLKMIINHLSMEPVDIDGMESSLFYSFTQMLLEFPSLSPIAIILARNYGFKKNLFFIHQLIEHKYMDRFVDLIYEIVLYHPEILMTVDTDGYLPCDRLKAIPDYYHYHNAINSGINNNRFSVNSTDSSQFGAFYMEALRQIMPVTTGHNSTNAPSAQKLIAKYTLLAKIINFAALKENRYLQTMTRGGIGVGLFSHYREEEELIILATHYDYPATEEEFVNGYFNLAKLDTRKHVPFLMKLIYKEVCYHYSSNYQQHQQQLSYLYHLLHRSLQNRISQRYCSREEIVGWIQENTDPDVLDVLFQKHGMIEEEGDVAQAGFAESKDHPSPTKGITEILQQNIDKDYVELSSIYKNVQEVWIH